MWYKDGIPITTKVTRSSSSLPSLADKGISDSAFYMCWCLRLFMNSYSIGLLPFRGYGYKGITNIGVAIEIQGIINFYDIKLMNK